jgi:protein ImuB
MKPRRTEGGNGSELPERPRSGDLRIADQTIPPEAAHLGKAVAAAFAASALSHHSAPSRNDQPGAAALPRLLCAILIPNFSLQSLLRHTPERRDLPIALIPDKTPRARITECTAAALARGAQLGMTPTQAQARCAGLEIVLRSETAERSARAALLDCAGAFAPYVEDTAPGLATLELKTTRVDPAHLAESIRARLARLHLEARLGFAPNVDLAFLAAQSAGANGTRASSLCGKQASCLSCGSPAGEPKAGWEACDPHRQGCLCSNWRQVHNPAELHPLPLQTLRFPPRMLEILHRWGITDLGSFVRLGCENLADRLGPEVLPLFAQATGAIQRPLKCLPPAQSYEEAVEFEHEIETLDPLLFMLRRLLEQIIVRLETTYLVAAKLTLRLGFSHRATYERTFKIPAPTARVDVLFRALHTHLERFSAEEPIISLALSAEPCRPPRQQFGLFESALRDPNQFYETLARLAALLGNDRVGFPEVHDTHRPDSFHLRETAAEPSPSSSSSHRASQNSRNPSSASAKKPANPSHNSRNPFVSAAEPPSEAFQNCRSTRAPLAPPPCKSFQNYRNSENKYDQSDHRRGNSQSADFQNSRNPTAAGALRANGPTFHSPGCCEPQRASPGVHIKEDPALKGRDKAPGQREAPNVLEFPAPESAQVGASTNEPLPSVAHITAFRTATPTSAPPSQNSQNPTPLLTLRRFRPPLPAYVDLTPERRPTAFTSAALRGQVAAAQGPVQISGEWWGDRAWSRLEWDLELTDGLLCRLYYDAVEQQWFIEGLYD